jgi:CRP-like cAMP-binding protein
MLIDCHDCPLRRRPVFRQMAEDEVSFVSGLKSGELELGAHHHIVHAGGNGHCFYTLFSGWAFRYRMRGSKRQILDFLLPGDLLGLQSPMTGRVTHSICSITAVRLCVLDGQPFADMFAQQPELAAALMRTLLAEDERADTRHMLLGRQRPTERLGYLLLDLRARLRQRGMQPGSRLALPLTYELLADATGMSRSQLAHSLVELRERGWATVHDGSVEFGDVAAMEAACGYSAPAAPENRSIL